MLRAKNNVNVQITIDINQYTIIKLPINRIISTILATYMRQYKIQ